MHNDGPRALIRSRLSINNGDVVACCDVFGERRFTAPPNLCLKKGHESRVLRLLQLERCFLLYMYCVIGINGALCWIIQLHDALVDQSSPSSFIASRLSHVKHMSFINSMLLQVFLGMIMTWGLHTLWGWSRPIASKLKAHFCMNLNTNSRYTTGAKHHPHEARAGKPHFHMKAYALHTSCLCGFWKRLLVGPAMPSANNATC